MIKKTTIETQLDCRATAALHSTISDDLSKPDKPISDLLNTTTDAKETDESEDNESSSD
jgi:hypothetical protein